jgi:hypothetical protein
MLKEVAEIFDGPSAVLLSAQANPKGLSYSRKHEEEIFEDIEKV